MDKENLKLRRESVLETGVRQTRYAGGPGYEPPQICWALLCPGLDHLLAQWGALTAATWLSFLTAQVFQLPLGVRARRGQVSISSDLT